MRIPTRFEPKIEIPDGFAVVVDTREQKPLWESPKTFPVVHKALPAGDYSILGFENAIAIERKSADLFVSLGKQRKRFGKELQGFKTYEWIGLLIEIPEKEIYLPGYFTQMHPNAVYWSLTSIEVRFGVHIYYAENREMAKNWVLSRLVKFYKVKREGAK